ncbi:ABC transporter ATP-binding protein [Sporanaerobacter acetigenes]|uniref:Putative ABC transport system ATP-binding protein n=1 Tax=Sporanaerobacter acetigenes DSM 13106 TaxID=1123281 RepID=A0A1M5UJA3_9FIRM|nr:ABC transporter ATP-binding protein [Sporanaerobacter acetigenes]SHH63047.1 putative ABC transport system ATP-binding protein [Sporanaerobacter acetigenes DSM 13106]
MSILKAEEVSYVYKSKYQTVEAVSDVSCTFDTGKVYAIVGHSGSGKTTFLSLLAGLDLPTKGEIYLEDKPMSTLDRDKYRRNTASVVYQSFNLFPLLTALENVAYPMELNGISAKEAREKAKELISKVGLEERIYNQLPLMMSGGEQQRVAIARALAVGGKILLADEPTGNLDTANGNIVVELLGKLAHDEGYAVIIITHDMSIADRADVVYTMKDGKLTNRGGSFNGTIS